MRLPRMTTRRWMVVVVIVATLAASWVQAQRWIRYAAVWRDYTASRELYEEGMLLSSTLVLRSQRIMAAQLDLSFGREQQIRAITAHLTRVSGVIQAEINWPPNLHDRSDFRAIEIEDALGKTMFPMKQWLDVLEVKEGLAMCQDQLKKLKEK